MFGIGMQELLIILLIALFLFGAKKLPEIGSGLGRAIHNFKRGISEPDHLDIASEGASPEKPSPKKPSPDNEHTEPR